MAVGSSRTMHLGRMAMTPGDGDALLLPAGEQMRCVAAVFIHADLPQRVIHPLADLRRGDAEVLRREGDVLLHDVGYDLVIRVLKRPCPTLLADLQQQRFVRACPSRRPGRCRRWAAGSR